jgi:hypothetical protein
MMGNPLKRFLSFAAVLSVLTFGQAQAGSILFVADDPGTSSALNIATVLSGDGHTVTTVLDDFSSGNATLLGSLAGYDAVFWSASGPSYGGTHSNASVFSNLSSYVSSGGSVFVTGYDSVASPSDALLISFLGASFSTDLPGTNVGPLSAVGNSLTTGVVDITGVSPTGAWADRDALNALMADTLGLDPAGAGGYQWTLRSLGLGEIAYVSAGRYGTYASDDAAWLNTSAGGAGAYNAALRNFAYNATGTVPEPATLALMGLGLAGIGFARKKKQA